MPTSPRRLVPLLVAVLVAALAPLAAARPAPAATAPPQVVPALQRWTPGTGAATLSARSRIVVTAATAATGRTGTGAFYGTRTVLQLLTAGTRLPAGSTVDVPAYAERAIAVCACYTYYTDAWFGRLIRDMAYLKLNELHVELKVTSDRYPGINFWSYYTKPEMRSIVALAARYHVTVIPEVNSAGHIDPYLKNYPDLQLVGTDGVADPTRLDVTKPAAFTFYTGLIDEYRSVFPGPYWHMGADEYMLGSAYANYPQLLAYARARFGPTAVAQDAYIDFINRVDAYVRSKGMTLRIWNDGLTSVATVPLNKDVVVEHWLETTAGAPTAADLVDDGYQVMNAAYDLYYIRGGFQQDTAKLYGQGWTPLDFDSAADPAPNQPGVTGAELAVWPDNYAAETENTTQQGLFMPLRFLAQATWGSPRPADYATFTAVSGAVGHAPGWGPAFDQPVPSGTYTLHTGSGALAAPDTTVGSTLVTSASAATWQLTKTSDGYYQLASTSDGLCAEIRAGAKDRLGVPSVEGNPVTQQTCDPTRQTQKWQLEPVPGGYRIVNAITQQALDAPTSPGAVVQQPRPVAQHATWSVRS